MSVRCEVLTNWSTMKDGKCRRVFCQRDGEEKCGRVLYRRRLTEKLVKLEGKKEEILEEMRR